MNNNQTNFDPITGQPINQNNQVQPPVVPLDEITPIEPIVSDTIQPVQPVPTVDNYDYMNTTQQLIQNTPTVEQSKQDFIDTTQTMTTPKQEEKKDGPNITFIIILFVIILASILFLFPYITNLLGY